MHVVAPAVVGKLVEVSVFTAGFVDVSVVDRTEKYDVIK